MTVLEQREALQRILATHAITILFQPIASTVERRIVAYEALSRGPSNSPLHSPLTLFAAARAQLIAEVVVPALERGAWVLSDRSAYSSLAYQAGGRGLPLDEVRRLNDIALGGVWPEVAVLLRVDPSRGLGPRYRHPLLDPAHKPSLAVVLDIF